MTTVPLLTLNNGVEIPALGFGVFQTPPDETLAATDCVLVTPLGEVRAGLETQLAQLAERWSVA